MAPPVLAHPAQGAKVYFNVAARVHMAVMRSFMRRQLDRAMEPLCGTVCGKPLNMSMRPAASSRESSADGS